MGIAMRSKKIPVPESGFYVIKGEKVPAYAGPLSSYEHDMDPTAYAGYFRFRNQLSRCSSPNNKAFKHYGAKGVQVKYGPREFVSFWVHEVGRLGLEKPSVGRIDHDGDYDFDNIEIVEHADNAREMQHRNKGAGAVAAPRRVRAYKFVGEFESTSAAAKALGVHQGSVAGVLTGRYNHTNDYTFHYIGLPDDPNYAPTNSRAVLAYKDGVQVGRYPSIMKASKELGVNYNGVRCVCIGKQSHTSGYVFKFEDEVGKENKNG